MQLKTYQSTTMLASALLVLGFVAYWAALYGFFLSDDFVHVQYLQRMDADINVLLKNFWSNWLDVPTTLFYRPLISVTLYLDHLIWGWRPLGYHVTNILMHGGNGILVFLLAQRITADRTAPPPLLLPFLGGMLFLIWPLHPEAVYWIIGRVDVQVTFFYLLSIYLFVLYAGDLRKRAWLWGSLLSFVAALMSKEPAVTLPAVLAAYALFFLSSGQGSIFKRAVLALRVTMPFWGALALYFLWRWHVLGTFGGGYTGGSADYFSADYWGRWTALAYLLVPINQAWPASASHKDVTTSLFLISWGAIAVAASWKLSPSASSKLLFGLAAFTISLLPLAPVFHVAADLQSSRFLYLPAAFLWITVVGVLNVQSKNPGNIAARTAIAALFLLIVLSTYQLRLNLQPWVQASKDIKLLNSSLSDLVAEREHNPTGGRLMVLAGIPDNFFGAQFLRNGYGGFFSAVFHQYPIDEVTPLTDDDRTGMPIHAKNLAATASERLYGVYRYIPAEGFKRVDVGQKPVAGTNSSTCIPRVDDTPIRRKLNDMVDEGDHWRVSGPDPSVLFEVNDCHAGDIDALRLSLAYTPPAAINNKNGTIQAFWRGTDTSFSEDRSMTMPVIADGAIHTYTIPVKSSAKWDSNQTLDELRLDLPGQPGGRVTFDQTSFLLSGQQTTFPQYSGARLEALDVSRISGAAFDAVRSVLTLDIQKRDEFLLLPRDAWNPVHGDLFTIRMRVFDMKRQTGSAKLYWATDKAPAFSEDKSFDFTVRADGLWHTYAIPLKHLPAWWTNGEGRQLRLNPYYGQAKVEISSISLGSTTPLPRLTFLDDGVKSLTSNVAFRRVNRHQAEMVQLAYQTLDGYTNSVLLVSTQPFPNPNLPDETHALEFKRNLPGMSGIIKISPDQFNGPGMRYLRVMSLDSNGRPSQFTSDPIALLVEK